MFMRREPQRDTEGELLRARLAMEGLEDLLGCQAEGDTIRTEPLAALIGLVFDTVRDAMPALGPQAVNDAGD